MKLNNIDFNKLKYLSVLAEEQSLKKASELVGVTNSAMHQSIKKLEKEIGDTLFFRSGNAYIATDACKQILSFYHEFEIHFNNYLENKEDGDISGIIKVGLPINFSKTVFNKVLQNFFDHHPHISFHVKTGKSQDLCNRVLEFDLDLAFIDERSIQKLSDKLHVTNSFKEELQLSCSKDFFNSHLRSKKLSLSDQPHIAYSESFGLLKSWYEKNRLKFKAPETIHIVDNLETIKQYVSDGFGVAVLPMNAINQNSSLRVVKKDSRGVVNNILMIQNLDYIPSVPVKKLLEFI